MRPGNPRIVTSAYSFGRVVSEIEPRPRQADQGRPPRPEHGDQPRRRPGRPDAGSGDHRDHREVAAAVRRVRQHAGRHDHRGHHPRWHPARIGSWRRVGGRQPGRRRPAVGDVGQRRRRRVHEPGWCALRSDVRRSRRAEGDGVVTFGEAFTFQPFGNTLVTFPMTGAQIVSVLEEQCQPLGSSRPFLHLGVSDGLHLRPGQDDRGGRLHRR